MAILALNTSAYPQRGQPAAPSRFAGDVARPVAQAAGVGSSHHLGHQRRASADLDQRRSGGSVRSVSAARLARRRMPTPKIWDQVDEIPDAGVVGSAPAAQAPSDRLCAGARGRQSRDARKAPAAEVRRLQEVLDPDALTIGFARRFATYKRATLLFRDVDAAARRF